MKRDPKPHPAEKKTSPDAQETGLRVHAGQTLRLEGRVSPEGNVTLHGGWRAFLAELVRSGKFYAVLAVLLAGIALLGGLTRYPPQVIPDEIYPSLRAADLLQNNFKAEDGAILPVFMSGSTPYAVGSGAYLQVVPQFFRPNTLGWIRGFNALLGLLGALLLTAWLKHAMQLKHSWAFLLLLAGMPAWFCFTRTGLDIALASGLWLAALGCYGFYRAGRQKFFYGAVVLGMLAFYAAPAARLAVPSAMVMLALFDWRYHRQNRKAALQALLLAAVMAVPLGLFLAQNPEAVQQDWLAAGSFLTQNLPVGIKLGKFTLNILNGFNPFYWFLPDTTAPAYYQLGGRPPVPYLVAPFTLLGAAAAMKKLREPAYRLLWIGWLAAAIGAAPYGGHLPELLLAVPCLVVMTLLGLLEALRWLQAKWKPAASRLSGPVLLVGAGGWIIALWAGAMFDSPKGQVDYGRDGLQYGAPQIFAAAVNYAEANPGRSVLVWPEWSTDPEALRRFFVPQSGERVRLGVVDPYLHEVDTTIDDYAFVLPEGQYQLISESGKFDVDLMQQIVNPDGAEAFSLVELAYTPQAASIMEQEKVRRRDLIEDALMVDNEIITVRHSALDLGELGNLFDGIQESLVRSAEANPLVIELEFAQPRRIDGVLLQLGSEPVVVTAVINPGGANSQTVSLRGEASEGAKELGLDFDDNLPVKVLRLEVRDETAGEPAHVHLWEIVIINSFN